jgi:DNA-binding NtrC family response regulator
VKASLSIIGKQEDYRETGYMPYANGTLTGSMAVGLTAAETARILLVDDDEAVRKSISKALALAGYLVDTAEDAKEALGKAAANFYNLAIIDLRLPDMEGTRLLAAMKDTAPKMVKVILTGYASLQSVIEAVNKGADGYLTKPVNMEELIKAIKERLEEQSKARKYDQTKIKEFVEARLKEFTSA